MTKYPITRVVLHESHAGWTTKAYDDRGWLRSGTTVPDTRAYVDQWCATYFPDAKVEVAL